MKFFRNISICLISLSFLLFITGCSEKGTIVTDLTIDGYILKIENSRILVAENITTERYEEIKDKRIEDLLEDRISLIYLSYDNTEGLKVGNKVEAWIDGGVDTSNPAQSKAKKVEIKD